MADTSFWPWAGLVALGAWHGLNPGMGWLFAVALGLQGQGRRGVWLALLPLSLGHGLAIAVAILLAGLVGLALPLPHVKWLVAVILLGLGVRRLVRSRHPRFGGMQVGARDLTVWSFLMASAHGAGLMALPFVLGLAPAAHAAGHHATHQPTALARAAQHAVHAASVFPGGLAEPATALLATALHTASYLAVTSLVAVIVYERLGLRLLRSLWFNVDLVWAGALIVTAVLTPLL
jgi:hypothetical protein